MWYNKVGEGKPAGDTRNQSRPFYSHFTLQHYPDCRHGVAESSGVEIKPVRIFALLLSFWIAAGFAQGSPFGGANNSTEGAERQARQKLPGALCAEAAPYLS